MRDQQECDEGSAMGLAERSAGPGLGLLIPGWDCRGQGYAVTLHADRRHACVHAHWSLSHNAADQVPELFSLEYLAKCGMQDPAAADPEMELHSVQHHAECGWQQHAACCHAGCEILSCHVQNPQVCQQDAALSSPVSMAC